MEEMMERLRSQGGAYGRVLFICLGQQIEHQKNTKIKYNMALDGRGSIFYT
jgi:hypothetical protein